MSDSFADLWNSTAPSKPPPQKLGAATSALLSQPRRPQQDAFSLLSSAGSSAPTSRPITPASNGLSQKKSPTPVTGQDAFSGLLSGSLSAGGSNGANLTIAERAAKAEKERREGVLRHQEALRKQASAWDGLDSLAKQSAVQRSIATPDDDWAFEVANPAKADPIRPSAGIQPSVAQEDDWGFGFAQTQSSSSTSLSASDDNWEFDEFSSKTVKKSPSPRPAPSSQSLWDLDEFSSRSAPPERSNTLGDFDFGNREDGLLDDDSENEDDILGVLSKPVDTTQRRPPVDNPARTPPSSRATPPQRGVSPPPHIIGQIVEMGFSPQQARTALAATDTGIDVQSALEMLLSNTDAPSARPSPPRDPERPSPPRHPLRRPVPARSSSSTTSRAADSPPSNGQTAAQLQDQADKILAQASEIGLSVFNRANAFWNTGKEKVQKAYEERAAATAARGGSSRGGGTRDGRPRWMQEAAAREAEAELPREGGRERDGGFADDDDEVLPVLPPKPARASKSKAEAQTPPQPQQTDLFGLGDAPTSFYVSPFRRGRPKAQTVDSVTPPSRPENLRVPTPIPLTERPTVSASAPAIALSAKHKASGTEMYKLGRYAEAETAYSAAISALPSSHLLLVPLYNNRALTRLKTGEHAAAIDDCTEVITLIGMSYHPAREKKIERNEDGAEVDLGDGLIKAWRRRAEAWEGREKWEEARKDWEAVAAAEWTGAKMRSEAVRGAGRCRRMVSASSEPAAAAGASSTKPPPAKPRAPRPPVRRGPTPPSQALNKLREANSAAEAEDQQRYELKDTVDARLLAWKGGKETNIRALIASLDSVLWPELGWVKVGMGELVSPSQVKIRYTKAIAKLHPDKLNVGNTTLEQRMIANGVFGALNEAWNAFKQ